MILGSSSSPSTHFNLLQPRTSGSAGTPTDLRGISRTEKRSSVRNGPCFCNCVWTIFPIEQNLLYTQCSWFFDCCLMGFWWFFAFRYTKFQYFGVSSCAKTGAQVASVGPRYAWHTTWDDQRVRSGVLKSFWPRSLEVLPGKFPWKCLAIPTCFKTPVFGDGDWWMTNNKYLK